MTGRAATVAHLVREGAQRLRAAGVDSPDHDAAELLAHVLGVPRGHLTFADQPSIEQVGRYDALLDRRATREPLQHITGLAAFRHVELRVGPGVFVPRPETELLAGWAVEHARRRVESGHLPVVVDLCTGSGAIALAVRDEVPEAAVHAVELDDDAFGWATRNLDGTGVDLRHGDMVDAFPDLDGTVDVVVCNPPYIPLEAYDTVAPEARDFDPALALWSGQDGLDSIRVLEGVAVRLLRPGGVLGTEHADVQGAAVQEVFAASGRWTDVTGHRDLAGRPRYVTAALVRGPVTMTG